MTDYRAPLADIELSLAVLAGMDEIQRLPGHGEATPALIAQVLAESGRLTADIWAPLNAVGDEEGSRLENGRVITPPGFAEAYRALAEGGWVGLTADPAYGGQGLPRAVGAAIQEMWHSANMALGLCPLLSLSAIELLQSHGTDAQKATYLPKLIEGRWSGTMNLTEPQAGSDVGALTTRATREGDHYRIRGQKIFITWGEHDMAENVVHLVLARIAGAPAGTKGVSLFLVPKFLPKPDGSLGPRNDLRCLTLESKIGIKASPTCVMAYGENEGAIGYLVGQEHRGMEGMFVMMNSARLAVGIEGLGIAERALQQARAYAHQRIQGRIADRPAAILHHPDVRRMLLTMRALTEAARALVLYAAGMLDRAQGEPDPAKRATAQARIDLLTPIVKSWATDRGVEVASLNIQIHGGLGFIEPTGAGQLWRDSRIAPIYEGTNGIQAIDLLGRKLARDEGAGLEALIAEMAKERAADPALDGAIACLQAAAQRMRTIYRDGPQEALTLATAFLELAGTVIAGWLLRRLALAAPSRAPALAAQKSAIADFYADFIMPRAQAEAAIIAAGGGAARDLAADDI